MPDYTITLKVRCRKRTVLQDIDRITKMGRFQETFEFAIASYLEERLRGAYLDVSEVDITARFSRKRKVKTGGAAVKTVAPAPAPKPARKAVKVIK